MLVLVGLPRSGLLAAEPPIAWRSATALHEELTRPVDLFWSDLAEVKSLAVSPQRQGQGVGAALMRAAEDDARRLGIRRLFALTYERDFFAARGFGQIDRDTLPEKVWRECIACPKADACDEIAMMKEL